MGCVTRILAPRTVVVDGRRLRAVRGKRGLSQEALAFDAGVGLTTLARLERRCCAPCRAWTLARLAVALGEDPGDLLVQAGSARHGDQHGLGSGRTR